MPTNQDPSPIRVLICDDSAVVRSMLSHILRDVPRVEITAKASDGQQAVAAVQRGSIDVVVLDTEMPIMNGLEAIPHILAADRATRVLMSSSLTTKGAAVTLEALRLGASDFVPKPTAAADGDVVAFTAELVAKVQGLGRLAHARRGGTPKSRTYAEAKAPDPAWTTAAPPVLARLASVRRPALLAIGSSTGGPTALLTLFQAIGSKLRVPVVLCQHMPASFTAQLAGHIQKVGSATCAEAVHGEPLRAGHIHLAPGDRHLTVVRAGGVTSVSLTSDPPENFCRPAVDPMLRTAAVAYPGAVLAAILTGMGQDGLAGARQVAADGGTVLAQDEETSVVWGMPGAVARARLCQAILPIEGIAARIVQLAGRAS